MKRPAISLFDYGAGNIHSIAKALLEAGTTPLVETDPNACLRRDILVLPGVGAFGQAASRLAPGLPAMRDAVRGGLPVIGICLGMQLLFSGSDEGDGLGLDLIPGRVVRLTHGRIPHMGWNVLETAHPLFTKASFNTAYFAHSYYCVPTDPQTIVARTSREGGSIAAAVKDKRILGFQFHPEKSGGAGIALLREAIHEVLQ